MSAETIKQAVAIIKKMDLTKVDLKLVRKHLKDEGLSHTGTASECVERLMAHQIQVGGKDLLECDVCHAFSAQKYSDCPFCDGIDPAKKGAAPAAEVVETTGEETSEDTATTATKAASKKTTTKAKSTPPPAATTSPAVAELASPSKKASKKTVAKKAPAKKAPSKKAPSKPTPAPATPLVKSSGKTEVLSAKALDVEVAAIKKAQAKGTDALFEVGSRMLKIRENGLHTLRLDPESGKPIYKRLEDFTQAELGMSRGHAQLIMNVVEGFKPEDVRDVGVAKLGLFVSLKSKETREELLALAREGAPVSKIREEVERLTDGGDRKRRDGFRGTPATPRRAPQQSEPITVATTEQAITVPFLDAKGAQATKFADGLVGQEKTANGILITYKLVVLEGIGVGLEVTRVRA